MSIATSSKVLQVRPIVNSVETKINVDRAAFLECYARIMMRFTKLTLEKLKEVRSATVAVLLPPAGGGKTFNPARARGASGRRWRGGAVRARNLHWRSSSASGWSWHRGNQQSMLFACRWHPLKMGRAALEDGSCSTPSTLVVVDEAHHLVNDVALVLRSPILALLSDAPIVARRRRQNRSRALARGSAAGAGRRRNALRGRPVDEAHRRGRQPRSSSRPGARPRPRRMRRPLDRHSWHEYLC